MQNRIKKLMEHYGLTASELAARLEVGKPVVSHILSGRNNPSVMVLEKIAERFEGLSLNWLITGKGDMHLGPATPKVHPNPELVFDSTQAKDEAPAPYSRQTVAKREETQPHRAEAEKKEPAKTAPPAEKFEKAANVSKIIVVGSDGSVSLFVPE